jgi:hypothetical protein
MSDDDLDAAYERVAHALLSAEELARPAGLPPRGQGWGDWYMSLRTFATPCRNCHTPTNANRERMCVLEYLADLDGAGLERSKHPGWDTLGWLAWYQCTRCGYQLFAPVSVETVSGWGRAGWERLEK